MAVDRCRVCGQAFFPAPLLRYENMPRAAQFLPDAAALATERGVDLEVCQCAGCGLVQLSNEPVPYHREVVRAAAFSEDMRAFRVEQFAAFVRKHSLEGRKVLEVGCGRGEYLSLLRQSGADAYGLEDAAGSVTDCLGAGLKVQKGYLADPRQRLEQGPFDAFCILNFLEHMPDPNAALRGVANNLKDGAVGLVEVPNFDMILRSKLFSEFIPDHLFYFTTETLSSTLRANGFEVAECGEIWHDYILSATVRKRTRLELSAFYDCQGRLKTELERYLAGFPAGRVAVWGAGHQALAVLALTGVRDRVKYVVDSAPFKQGRFTPATHLPIVAPETLVSDPVDAVIIMAAAYSDEVARTVRRRFGAGLRVAILRDTGLEALPAA